MAIKKGDTIKINYTGKFPDGHVFDSSEGRTPLEFKAGTGMVIKGLDDEIIGMVKGDKKTITIPPEKAYGLKQDNLLAQVERSQFPQNLALEKGLKLSINPPGGMPFIAEIVDFDEKHITLDLNHPMAGKTLVFDIEIVSVEENS
ncbi:MAG: peptidylprolyl isomerase [archaeon]